MSLKIPEAAQRIGYVVYLELMVLGLSLYSLATLCLELFLPLNPVTRELLSTLDLIVCGVFLIDFAVHLWLAPDKRAYLKWGWIDLVSSIPVIEWLRWGRIFRVVRILRALRSFNTVAEHFALDPAKGTFGAVSIMSVLSALFATIAVLHYEQGAPGANIRTAGDALWWAFATITTIGYGDRYPVTAAGRIVAMLLVVCGLSIFGTFTALVASFFVGRGQKREEVEMHHVLAEVRRLREALESRDIVPQRLPGESPPVPEIPKPEP